MATQQGVDKEGPQVLLTQATSLLASQGPVSDDQSHWGSEVSQGQAPDQTSVTPATLAGTRTKRQQPKATVSITMGPGSSPTPMRP